MDSYPRRMHRQRAEDLGATLLLDRATDETEPLYVLADPAGHPFCLLVGELEARPAASTVTS